MDSDDSEMRYEAATAAGELGEAEAVSRLIELTTDTDMEVKIAAIQALGKIGGQEVKQRLQTLVSSKSQAIRDAAEQALSEIDAYAEPTDLHVHEFDEADTD
jgi:HEAT repeat protein